MSSVARNPYVKAASRRSNAAYALLAFPVLGMGGFFWVVSHRVTRPDITIFESVERGDVKAVYDHLATGTPVNSISDTGHTPLYLAIATKKPAIVQMLLEKGADVEGESKRATTPLYVAAAQGDVELVKELLGRGAKADEVFKNGATSLHAACESGNPEIVKMLLDRGANVSATLANGGGTPLCMAALSGSLECIDLLLAEGADVNVRSYNKKTPLHLAAQRYRTKVVTRLIEKGADPDAVDDFRDMPINFALQRNDEATIELLMARTSRITRTDSGGRNLLHWAVNGRVRPPVIQQLIDKGCDYDRMDTNGETPLTLATRTNQTKTVAVLHAAGARVPLRYLVRRALTTEKPFKPGFLDYE